MFTTDDRPGYASLEQPLASAGYSAPDGTRPLQCIELFAGCGGLAYGLDRAGFQHIAMAEFNRHACSTLRRNFLVDDGAHQPQILEQDVRTIDWRNYDGVDLVAGGPPCQPFSNGGLAAGQHDPRDMWPEAIRSVSEMRPRAFLFENVKGLTRPAFSNYLSSIVEALERGGSHEAGTEKLYSVVVVPVNAADYGAAQKRERVLIAGIRGDCGMPLPFPAPTHTHEMLVWEKWVTGRYWRENGLCIASHDDMSRAERSILARIQRESRVPCGLPWQTCRQAFRGLGAPSVGNAIGGHEPTSPSRQYPGHTGSPIDSVAKALKSGVHGVPGGENMLVDESGLTRHFTTREAARLQGLPDTFELEGSWSAAMRQLGNGVPAQLANVAGRWIAEMLVC